ncbi:MAG: heme lyase CcmF/NrfE family subunit [Chloroflexi bacterium]|nr:heme lyase CcmF/NrfE family subunit [Chloroflexota bacterium]
MIAELGIVFTSLALLVAIAATLLAILSVVLKDERFASSARNALLAVFPLLSVACLLLIYAQWTGEYSIDYVNSVSANSQPQTLKVTALWGSQAGSLLFYSWMLSLFSASAVWFNWKRQHHLMPWVMVFVGATIVFFTLLNVFYENAFARTWIDPSGNRQTIEVSVLKPEGKVVAYPWKVEINGQSQADYGPSNTIAPQPGIGEVYDGHGLNPLLRHPGMVIHPPMLYLGFTGFVIPFAFAMAALMMGHMDADWIRAVRRWSLIAWVFLSIGLILGGRWAYDVLGWGGYWGWDPVENSAFLPWLTGTAFLHSVMIQEKRGMLKGWNMVMIIATYLLVLLGTVATRTGLLSSVHTFAESPLAIPMGAFLLTTLIGSTAAFLWRGRQGYFKGDHEIEGIFSRESMFMLNNWVFFALAIVVFWGTWAEKITDLAVGVGLRQNVITLGPDYYRTPTAILFLIIYILMGVAPLVAWRRATAEKVGAALRFPIALTAIVIIGLIIYGISVGATIGFGIMAFAGFATLLEISKGAHARHKAHGEPYPVALYKLVGRDRRRYGGYIIHLGIVVIGIGVIGSTIFQKVTQQTITPGQTISLGAYTMRLDNSFLAQAEDDRTMSVANVTLFHNGKEIDQLRPRRDFFPSGSPMTIAGVHSNLEGDFYSLLVFTQNDQVTFRVYFNPLVNFVWWGGVLLIIGTIIAAWPSREPAIVRQTRRSPVAAIATAGD